MSLAEKATHDRTDPGVGAGSLLHSQLLADDRSTRIGAVYRIDYGEAIVLTHDKWKFDVGGILSTRSCSLRLRHPPR
jgi:hypothetical protein